MAHTTRMTGLDFIYAVAPLLDLNPDLVVRIVIDGQFNNFVTVYVEQLGSDKMVKIDWAAALKDTAIRVLKKDDTDAQG